jgi:hypothetical protein
MNILITHVGVTMEFLNTKSILCHAFFHIKITIPWYMQNITLNYLNYTREYKISQDIDLIL